MGLSKADSEVCSCPERDVRKKLVLDMVFLVFMIVSSIFGIVNLVLGTVYLVFWIVY